MHAYFSSKGYYMATGNYGGWFNGYMGIAVAVPIDRYDISAVDISRVAETKPYYRKPSLSLLAKWIEFFWGPIKRLLFKAPFDVWHDVERRYNQMITMKLKVNFFLFFFFFF